MPEVNKHEPGSFSWVELATTDIPAAKDFYGALFGWVADDQPVPQGGSYTMFRLNGLDAAGAYEKTEDQRDIPPFWGTYFTVEDVDVTTKRVEAAGGSVMLEPFDVMDVGRMAVLSDPTGAVFFIWQPGKSIGARVKNEHGALGWCELWSTDQRKASEFYSEVFDWKPEEVPMGPDAVYILMSNATERVCGISAMTPELQGHPSFWLNYFEVDDCEGTVSNAKKLGGDVTFGPFTMEGVGTFAGIRDPQNAQFAVLQSESGPA